MKTFDYFMPGWETGQVHSVFGIDDLAMIAMGASALGGLGLSASGAGQQSGTQQVQPTDPHILRRQREALLRRGQTENIIMQELGFTFRHEKTGKVAPPELLARPDKLLDSGYYPVFEPEGTLPGTERLLDLTRARTLGAYGDVLGTARRTSATMGGQGLKAGFAEGIRMRGAEDIARTSADILAGQEQERRAGLFSLAGLPTPQTGFVSSPQTVSGLGGALSGVGDVAGGLVQYSLLNKLLNQPPQLGGMVSGAPYPHYMGMSSQGGLMSIPVG